VFRAIGYGAGIASRGGEIEPRQLERGRATCFDERPNVLARRGFLLFVERRRMRSKQRTCLNERVEQQTPGVAVRKLIDRTIDRFTKRRRELRKFERSRIGHRSSARRTGDHPRHDQRRQEQQA
jgi:hypothetical protein